MSESAFLAAMRIVLIATVTILLAVCAVDLCGSFTIWVLGIQRSGVRIICAPRSAAFSFPCLRASVDAIAPQVLLHFQFFPCYMSTVTPFVPNLCDLFHCYLPWKRAIRKTWKAGKNFLLRPPSNTYRKISHGHISRLFHSNFWAVDSFLVDFSPRVDFDSTSYIRVNIHISIRLNINVQLCIKNLYNYIINSYLMYKCENEMKFLIIINFNNLNY